MESARHCNRVAIQVEHEPGAARGGTVVETQTQGRGQAARSMGALQFSIDEFVADRGPTQLTTEVNPQSLPGKETEFLGNNQRRTVIERHKSQANRGLPRGDSEAFNF